MLENMFVGKPPGNYDRLLDFSVAKTGTLFFVPSATFLDSVTDEEPAAAIPDQSEAPGPEPSPDWASRPLTWRRCGRASST